MDMPDPRFIVESAEALVDAVRQADPPVRSGERAELRLPNRSVLLESTLDDRMMVWVEVRP